MKFDDAEPRPGEGGHALTRAWLSLGLLWLLVALGGCAGPVLAPNLGESGLPADVELTHTPFFPQDAYHCGPAALATVLRASAVPVTPDMLVGAVYLPQRRGALQTELVATARRYDRVPYVIEPTLEAAFAELAAGHPVLVMQNLASASTPVWHYAVLVGYSMADDTVVLRSGTEARQVVSARRFLGTWARAEGWAMLALRPGELPAQADRERYVETIAEMEGVASANAVHTAYNAALRRWPNDLTALFGEGNMRFASGDRVGAEAAYRRVLRNQPNHIGALNNLASVLGERGCLTEANALIERALALSDQAPQLLATLRATQAEIAAALRRGDTDANDCPTVSADTPAHN